MKKIRMTIIFLFIFSMAAASAMAKQVNYTGTGIIPGIKNGVFVVRGLYPHSPAKKAGVKIGDKIVKISSRYRKGNDSLLMINRYLNPQQGRSFTLTVDRHGRRKTFKLTSKTFEVTSRTIPKTDVYRGKITGLSKGSIMVSDLKKGKVNNGDRFYVVDGSKCLGTASIVWWKEGRGHLNLRYDPSIDKKELVGAHLHFFSPGVRSMAKKAKLAVDPVLAKIDDSLYHKYKKRKDLKKNAGEVVSHDKRRRRIVVDVTTGMSQVSPHTIMRKYKYFPIYYQAHTPSIPKNKIRDVKPGDYIGFFYKKLGGKNYAKLIHLLKKYKKKK